MSLYRRYDKYLKMAKKNKQKLINIVTSVFLIMTCTYLILTSNHRTTYIQELDQELTMMENLTYELEGKLLQEEDRNEKLQNENQSLKNEIQQFEERIKNKDSILQDQRQEIERLETKVENFNNVSRGGGHRNFKMTSYTAFCDTGCIGITATGVDVRNTIYHQNKRVIAVDPNVIPLNSTVQIQRENGETFTAKAVDTGGAIKGNKIDLLVGSKEKAIQNGVENVQVKVLN
ncbi:3D domain-containing protein [Halalkalibacter oceani]|uniref:3D domain-containing protein n=1 Tax=Halalkalibacter oceani TaxID=1653776 RepID=UPI00339221D3